MKKIYNKLVRDNIPEIIRQEGAEPKIRILEQTEYLHELLKKIDEEIKEFAAARASQGEMTKEAGDVYEVLEAIIKGFGLNYEEIMTLKKKRRKERGGFEKKIFLESVNNLK